MQLNYVIHIFTIQVHNNFNIVMLKYLKTCIKKCLVSFKIYKYPSSHPLSARLKESILFLFLSNVQTMSIANNSTKGKGAFYIINFIFLKKEKKKSRIYLSRASYARISIAKYNHRNKINGQ